MLEHEFFITEPTSAWGSFTGSTRKLSVDLLYKLRVGPQPGDDDLQSAIELCKILSAEYRKIATDGAALLTDDDGSRAATAALRDLAKRHGIEWSIPWSDFPTFKIYWKQEGYVGHGSWQARRDLISKYFLPLLQELEALQVQRQRNDLATAVSPHDKLGWNTVDNAIEQLRERFATATTTADYKDVGNRCVGVLEALSELVYNPKTHLPAGESVPPVDKTYVRIGAYIGDRLPGKPNEKLRALCKKASELAHSVKHSPKADRTTSGIAADSVILLANILRRLEE